MAYLLFKHLFVCRSRGSVFARKHLWEVVKYYFKIIHRVRINRV
jgi:hypothetical protein